MKKARKYDIKSNVPAAQVSETASEPGARPAPVARPARFGWFLACFLTPVIILTAVYALEGFYPFGDKSILISDMGQQYVEFFCALKSGDVFFSWSKALGSPYIGVFSFIVSSPLSLLTLLAPNESMPLGLMVLTILKLGLAGLTYAFFSACYFKRLDAGALLCATGYALCSYAICYALSIMWLDGLIWLPVVLLGLEKVLAGEKRGRALLALSLAVCFWSTWYISYMIGVFCCLWFVLRAVARKLWGKALLTALRDFLFCALWALCLTAWIWLPTFLSTFAGKQTGGLMTYSGLLNFDRLTDLLPQFLPGQYQYFTNDALPLVFCGTAAAIAAAVYFFLPVFPLRERLTNLAAAAALILSLWLSPLDRVWHLFQYPNWFPYRYAFVVSFFVLFLAQHTLGWLLEVLQRQAPKLPQAAPVVLAAALCLEMGYNARVIFQGLNGNGPYESYSAYQSDYAANADLVAAAQADGTGFYRMGATYDRGLNGPLAFGYNGITHYSSLYNSSVNKALKSLGFAQTWYWCAYYGSTPFTDALFDIPYVITDRPVPGYTEMASSGNLSLWKSPAAFPLAFLADGVVTDTGSAAADLQNELFSALTGEETALFTPAYPETVWDGTRTTLTYAGNGQPIYLDLTGGGVSDLRVNGESLFRYHPGTHKEDDLHCLGAPAAGESLTVEVYHDGSWDGTGKSWTYDAAPVAAAAERFQSSVQDLQVRGSRVTLATDTDRAQTLVTTIPLEDGWAAYVDGRRVEPYAWLNGAFLALDLPAGAHTVELRFTLPGLWPGLALGGLAVLIMAVLLPRRVEGKPGMGKSPHEAGTKKRA